jgi:hypothetical protein
MNCQGPYVIMTWMDWSELMAEVGENEPDLGVWWLGSYL